MNDLGIDDGEQVDFLTAETGGAGQEAASFRSEQPAGSSDSIEPKPNISTFTPVLSETSEGLSRVREELAGVGKEANRALGETVLIFGQGPVITDPEEKVNYWSEDLAESAAELMKRDTKIKNFVVMGGKTGGKESSSEAHLIAKEMKKHGVDQESIRLEELSSDTVENIVNFLNIIDDDSSAINQKFNILTAPYHSSRTRVLMQLFKVPVGHVFHSTEVMRYVARIPQGEEDLSLDSTKWRHGQLQSIEDKVNINDPTKYSSTKTSASEQRDVADRYIKDNLWTRELIEHPEKWLPYVGKLNNGQRVKAILTQFEDLYPGMLAEKYGITLPENADKASLANVKTQLGAIPQYKGLTEDIVSQWVKDNKSLGWPEEASAKVDRILEMSNSNKFL